MKKLLILVAACALWACSGDDKAKTSPEDDSGTPGPNVLEDAGTEADADLDPEEDAGTDASVPQSALPRPPGALPRPPTDGRLPADLWPPVR